MRTKYIWRCGDRYATIEMESEEMALLETDEIGWGLLTAEVDAFIGTHPHIFKVITDTSNVQVIYICEQWKVPKVEKIKYEG